MTARYVLCALRRRPLETLAAAVAVALTVAFLAAFGTFVGQTGSRLSLRAGERVAVDWQVQVGQNTDTTTARAALEQVPGLIGVRSVDYAKVKGLQVVSPSGKRTTGAAYVVSLPADYPKFAPSQIRRLLGSGSGALLQQQTAANLAAVTGTSVTVLGSGRPVIVDGIVDLPNADSFFQVIGAPPGSSPGTAPDNVLLVPPSRFAALSAGAYQPVPFHVVGVITEFATAPRDSFVLTNRAYLTRATRRSDVQTLLVRTDTPARVAASIHAPAGTLVNDITAPKVAVPSASGLAAGSLAGLARLTLTFGLLLAAASAGLVLIVGAAHRRRSLVALAMIGANARQRAGFLWTEARWITVAGVLGGLATGALIAAQLVKILNWIFDPPPQHPVIPVTLLAVLLATVGATATAATSLSARWAARVDASRLRDL
jgi:putative ABC transport system permease protein